MKRLVKQLEVLQFNYSAPLWDIVQSGGEYVLANNTANNARAQTLNQYIDLAGMTQQEKTAVIKGLEIQYQAPPSMTNAVAGDAVQIAMLITDVPATGLSFIGPGFAVSDISMQNCILHRLETWAVTTESGTFASFLQKVNETVNGMCDVTTSDRIYVSIDVSIFSTKIGAGATSTLDSVTVPGFRVVLSADVTEEPDFVYLMRQRRAYELQQSHDED
jgi:hypothetical protein